MSFQSDIMAEESLATAGDMPGDEQTIYTVGRTGGTVSVWINILRKGPQPIEGLAGAFTEPETNIFLYAGQGITAVDTGGDTIAVSRSYGGTPAPVPIADAISDTAGAGWTLRL